MNYLNVFMYQCIYVSMYLCINVFTYQCIYVSVYLCINVFIYQSIYVSIHLHIKNFGIKLFMYPCIHLFNVRIQCMNIFNVFLTSTGLYEHSPIRGSSGTLPRNGIAMSTDIFSAPPVLGENICVSNWKIILAI